MEPLTTRYHDIVNDYASISHLVDSSRPKRSAWISGIGTIFKHIFGTLTEDDAVKYDDAINVIQNNQKGIVSLMKQNILVTTSTIENYNKTFHKIQINEAILNEAIDRFSVNIKNLSYSVDQLTVKSTLDSLLINLETTMLTLSFQTENLLDGILFSSQNILHPSIITPQQLYRELTDNYKHLPSNFELPVSLEISFIHVLFKISNVLCYFMNNKIIFVLKIPLVLPLEYNLYNNIALPTPHQPSKPNSFSLIVPSSKYIGITKDKSQYCKLDTMTQCKRVSEQDFICDVTDVYSTDAVPCCESELLSKVISDLPDSCETKFIHGHINVWKPLRFNKWVYVQSKSTKLSIDCPDTETFDIHILGTGVLNIPPNCTAYCKSTRLLPRNSNVNISIPARTLKFNIVNDTCCNLNRFKQIVSSESPIKLQNIDLDEITTKNKIILKTLLDNSDTVLEAPHLVRYGTHYSVLTIVIALSIISFCIYRIFRFVKSGRSFDVVTNLRKSTQTSIIIPRKKTNKQTDMTVDLDPEIENIPSPSIRRNI